MHNLILHLAFSDATACGGTFCDGAYGSSSSQNLFVPTVVQTAEEIVFAVDTASGNVETHVRISYAGAPEDFGWIVPVPVVPELFVSSELLFTTLDVALSRNAFVTVTGASKCASVDASSDADTDTDSDSDSDSDADSDGSYGTVIVASEGTVGPFETVVLSAATEAGLLIWLGNHGYNVPPGISTALAPYVAGESWFIAMKLVPGVDTGTLAPFGFRYPGSIAQIPIQLTAVASASDLPIVAQVLGPSRAVPLSYLHLTVNDALLDWVNRAPNYADVVKAAAREAGGHGFATDSARNDIASVAGQIPNGFDTSALLLTTAPDTWVQSVLDLGLPANDALLAVFRAHIPIAGDVADTVVYSCMSCYPPAWEGVDFDVQAATDALIEQVTEPLDHAYELIANAAWGTRLTSSMSPADMTIDPTFGFNPSLPTVSPTPEVTVDFQCKPDWEITDAIREVTLPDGRVALLPPMSWIARTGTTDALFLSQWAHPAAQRIEQHNESTQATVVFDVSADGDAALEEMNAFVITLSPQGNGLPWIPAAETTPTDQGCACDQSAEPGALWGALLALLIRRRQGASAPPL